MDAVVFFAPENPAATGFFYGRFAANQGLLTALARHGSGKAMFCVTPTREDALGFRRLLDQGGCADRELARMRRPGLDIPAHDIGTFFRPDPNIGHFSWVRRAEGPDTAFSICGLTHSLVETGVITWLQELVVAPMQPWDAVVCTSRAARSLICEVFGQFQDHLAERLGVAGAARRPPLQLPIVPLGIDCAAFAPPAAAPEARRRWRDRLGIGAGDLAVLFFGRLSYFEKAHPAPLYLALEEAARRLPGRRFHLLQAGRFPQAEHQAAYRAMAAALAPSVACHILDGGDADVSATIRFAADAFVSLSDNVQETFGLTPVEAMAAGLPVVVSDWDGYRDTVADGETGFLIPTLSAPPGTGGAIAAAYTLTGDYRQLLGMLSQRTAVDISAAAAVFVRLAEDPALRRRLGQGGMERSRRLFDWTVVIPQYEALWAELRRVREAARATDPGRRGGQYPDPFTIFSSFPSGHADDGRWLSVVPGWRDRLAALTADALCTAAAPAAGEAADLVGAFAAGGGRSLGDFLALAGAERREELRQLALWLAKMHVLAMA